MRTNILPARYHEMTVAPSYGLRWPIYAKQWDTMIVKQPKAVRAVASRLISAHQRYLAIQTVTGVPWPMIACIHERESSQNWSCSLGQGDPWNLVSTHEPRGRGPFANWEAAAIDSLITLKHLDQMKDWRLEKILYHLEAYNGWGYYLHRVPSPYLWASSNQYFTGKYVSDGKWSPNAVDRQLGCAPILKIMSELDPTITFIRES